MGRKNMAWNSVHFGSTTRIDKAKEQLNTKLLKPSRKEVVAMVWECFSALEIIEENDRPEEPDIYPIYRITDGELDEEGNLKIDYKVFPVKDKRDIVWIKFTDDGYVGVVASSNDINFQIPNDKSEYDIKINNRWKYNSSGIIIKELDKEWDKDFVLVFPIFTNPNSMTRHGIEKAVGNYLIDHQVIVLDYYSHRIGGK